MVNNIAQQVIRPGYFLGYLFGTEDPKIVSCLPDVKSLKPEGLKNEFSLERLKTYGIFGHSGQSEQSLRAFFAE